jgi:hypothetical protein
VDIFKSHRQTAPSSTGKDSPRRLCSLSTIITGAITAFTGAAISIKDSTINLYSEPKSQKVLGSGSPVCINISEVSSQGAGRIGFQDNVLQ